MHKSDCTFQMYGRFLCRKVRKTGCNPFRASDIINLSSQKGEIYEYIKC